MDHGKTALVKALTNIDCDTHREEKERGITINLGFSHIDLPSGHSLGIVDVPGHKDFIRTMVAGAYGIDIVMLVIAADSGIMPQTEEHLRIIEMLGVTNGLVVITKKDLVDEETLELAELEITEYLEGTPLEQAPIVAVSSVTGSGIDRLIEAIEDLVPTIEATETGDVFRMYIDRIFNVKGIGFVVTGTVLEGRVSVGQDLFLLPGNTKKIKVRNIERHGESTGEAIQGDRAALNLSGLKQEDFLRGMMLSNRQLNDTRLMDATFRLFDPSTVLPVWSNVLLISGTFETAARMHLLDKDELHPGDEGLVQVHLKKPAVLSVKDKYIIRNSSNDSTLGGGTVIDISPLHHRKRTEKLVKNLQDLVDATLHSDHIVSVVKIELNKVNAPVFASYIAQLIDKPAADLLAELAEGHDKEVLLIGTGQEVILLRPDRDAHYQEQVLRELESYHQRNPILLEGMEANEFVGKFDFGKNEAGKIYLEHLMQRLHSKGHIKQVGQSWVLQNHRVEVDSKTQQDLEWLESLYLQTGHDLPVQHKMDEEIHRRRINKERLKMLQKYLAASGKLVYYEGQYLHAGIVEAVRNKLIQTLSAREDGINEKEFRELIAGTRKFVQVILGIFMGEGIVTKPTFYILITDKGRKTPPGGVH